MVIGACRVRLGLSASESLKEKRTLVKGLLAKVQQRFAVAAAEVNENDDPQHATLGFVMVSNSSAHANAVIDKVLDFIDQGQGDYEMLEDETKIEHLL